MHFNFADDPYIADLFAKSSPLYAHPPVSYNYWRGYWLKHPAQNNLAPLPEVVKMLDNVPAEVKKAAENLHWTCGYQVSLGFNRPDVAKHLWFYIYDKDVPPARVYFPNLKSPDNAPDGCSSVQAEVFFANDAIIPDKAEILEKTVEKLKHLCGFDDKDIVVKDIRFEKYGNIIFTPDIYESSTTIRLYLDKLDIKIVGRFGKWDYYWSHQAFKSAMNG